MTLPEASLLESARNYRNANPLLHLWVRHRHNSPLPQAAMAQGVFLLPLPRPSPQGPDRANRAPSPIPDAPVAENRDRRPSHPRVFPGGFRKLPFANRCQFAQARDAPPLHPQNFPAGNLQWPERVSPTAQGRLSPLALSHHLARGGPRPSMLPVPELSRRWHSRELLLRVAARTLPSKSGDPVEQTASSTRHLPRLAVLPAHPVDRTRPPAGSPGYALVRDLTLRTGKLHNRSGPA